VVWRSSGVLVSALLLLGLVACGGGGTSMSSTGSASIAPTTTSDAVTVPGRPAAEPPPRASGSVRALTSHGAKGFRVPRGDNSVPDFGQEAHASQRQLAIAALTAYMRARARGEWSKMCEYLARPIHRQMESFIKTSKGKLNGCGPVLSKLITGPPSERADTLTDGVAALRVKEKTAFALFYGPNTVKYVMPMQSEGGAWKMTQLAPLPYPLGTPAPPP
jgi:hypothetical protein